MVSDKNLPRDGMLDLVVLKTKNAVELLPTVFAKAVDHSGDLAKKLALLRFIAEEKSLSMQNPLCSSNMMAKPHSFPLLLQRVAFPELFVT